MSWVTDGKPADFGQLFGLRENLYEDYRHFTGLFWDKALVPPEILELCRLRVAQLHRCEPELARRRPEAAAAGLTEDKIAALGDWHRDARFTGAEKACLEMAELFAQDPHAISDEAAARAVEAIGDEGLVALLEALAMFDGFSRFQVLLDAGVERPTSDD